MKEKEYELKTTVADIENLKVQARRNLDRKLPSESALEVADCTLIDLCHDARLAHELLDMAERVQWRPIETATWDVAEDGTTSPILGLANIMSPGEGYAIQMRHDNADHFRDIWGNPVYPTHWMPLQSAPASEIPEIEGCHSIGWGEVDEHLRPAPDAGQEGEV